MGLDASAIKIANRKNKEIKFWDEREHDDLYPDNPEMSYTYIQEWRKHPHLQGYMESLYQRKGGDKEFNTTYLILTKEDIIDLQNTIKNREFANASGFFWGGDADDYYFEQDLQFCADALKAIEEGYEVAYWCWW